MLGEKTCRRNNGGDIHLVVADIHSDWSEGDIRLVVANIHSHWREKVEEEASGGGTD